MKTFLITLSILLLSTSSSIAYSSTGTAISPAESTTIMVYGDSLSAGYGLPQKTGWVSMLKTQLKKQQAVYQIINASISGETTLGGLNRIEQALKRHHPNIVIVELGANDGLRGLPIKSIHDNLEAIVKACKQNKASILLVGMRLPPNYGTAYTKKFSAIYQQIAKRHELRLVPFLLAGFGDKPEYFQEDKMHPNKNAQEKILNNVWKVLHKMIVSY
ncbi:MAG: arylesterase [Burkholderiales bacterium]|jgi:acyl-CoA thioesterase-1